MMKIFVLFSVFLSASGPTKAQSQGLRASEFLMRVLDEIYVASYDFPAVYLVEVKQDPIFSQIPEEGCSEVKAQVVKNHFKEVFETYQKFYPDNMLPFNQAKKDLEVILGKGDFLQCSEVSENKWEFIQVDHYRNVEGGKWIRFEVSQRKR